MGEARSPSPGSRNSRLTLRNRTSIVYDGAALKWSDKEAVRSDQVEVRCNLTIRVLHYFSKKVTRGKGFTNIINKNARGIGYT